jgi:outer membrane receptor protein involved in Fe transport
MSHRETEQSIWFVDAVLPYESGLRRWIKSRFSAIRDVDNRIFGSSEYQLDLWLRHRRTIFDDKVNWTLQLNIRNVLDEDDLIDVRLNYAGLPNIVRFNEGRRFILSTTFDF